VGLVVGLVFVLVVFMVFFVLVVFMTYVGSMGFIGLVYCIVVYLRLAVLAPERFSFCKMDV
jgi:hypothetical protein